MHGMVALDASGEVLRPCIMWNDQRSFAECDEMTSLIGKEQVLKITGNPILAGFTAPKILWVQKNEPDVFSSIDKILLPKDFIRYKLSGEFFSDVSDASGMSLPQMLVIGSGQGYSRCAWMETRMVARSHGIN